VPQTSATGQIIKKPKKPKKPKVPQAASGAVQMLSKKPRPQTGETKRKSAAPHAVAAGKETSLSSGNPFSVQKSLRKPPSKPVASSRKPAGKAAGGRGKRQP
jgi:hypothetical protein